MLLLHFSHAPTHLIPVLLVATLVLPRESARVVSLPQKSRRPGECKKEYLAPGANKKSLLCGDTCSSLLLLHPCGRRKSVSFGRRTILCKIKVFEGNFSVFFCQKFPRTFPSVGSFGARKLVSLFSGKKLKNNDGDNAPPLLRCSCVVLLQLGHSFEQVVP